MSRYDIELTDDKYQPFLPTYDQIGEQFAIDNYILGREGLYSSAQDALSTAGFEEQQRQATTGFAGSGTNLLDTTRSDIVSQFGREGQRMFSGLQQDIYGQRRGFEDQLLSAIGELDPEAYTVGDDDDGGGGAPKPPEYLGFKLDGSLQGGNNPDPGAPWNEPNYDPADHGRGASYTDANGYVYIFNEADGSWLWDGISGG